MGTYFGQPLTDLFCIPTARQSRRRGHVDRESVVLNRSRNDSPEILPEHLGKLIGKHFEVVMERAETMAVHHPLRILIAYPEICQEGHDAADLHTLWFAIVNPESTVIDFLF